MCYNTSVSDVISALEKLGVSRDRLTATIQGNYVRDDGFHYIAKTVFRNTIRFSQIEYNHIRANHNGDLLLFAPNGHFLGQVSLWNLPLKGGDVKIGTATYRILLPSGSKPYTSLSILAEERFLVEELRGELERKLRMEFPNIGSLMSQALVKLAAELGVVPFARADRWTKWNYSAYCPNCLKMHALRDLADRIIWVVECPCNCRFIAVKDLASQSPLSQQPQQMV